MSKERKFIHDISSPLAGAMFSLELVVDDLKGLLPLDSEPMKRIEAVKISLEKIQFLIQERRLLLIEQEKNAG